MAGSGRKGKQLDEEITYILDEFLLRAHIHALNALVTGVYSTRRGQRPQLAVLHRLHCRWTVHEIVLTLRQVELVGLGHVPTHTT